MDDKLQQTLQMAIETIEDVIKDITSKKDISPAQLEHLSKSVCIIEKLKALEQQENEYSENSYRRGRSRTSGRYMSRDNSNDYRGSGNSSRRYYDSSGYSGHSLKDRMIAKLEEMFDDAQSKHEEQYLQQWIDRLSHDF